MEAAAAAQGRADVIARLRAEIRRVQAAPRRYLTELATGVPALDALGAFRLGHGVELSGEEGSGRATVALSLVAAACRERRLCAWVDGPRELYPPAAVPLGVELARLLIVRPKEPGRLVWTAVQLLRSGAFTCVVLDVTHTGVRLSLTDSRKLQEAARAGGALLLLLTSRAAPAQGLVRFELRAQAAAERHLHLVPAEEPGEEEEEVAPVGWTLEVTHSARGGMGRRVEVPASALARRRPRMVRRRPGEGPRRRSSPHSVAPLVSAGGAAAAERARSSPHGLAGLARSVVPLPSEPGPSPHGRGFGSGSRPGRDTPLALSRDWR